MGIAGLLVTSKTIQKSRPKREKEGMLLTKLSLLLKGISKIGLDLLSEAPLSSHFRLLDKVKLWRMVWLLNILIFAKWNEFDCSN